MSIYVDQLQRRLGELPQGKTVVACCGGPCCVYADNALEMFLQPGWHVARLEEGMAEWQQAGRALSDTEDRVS
jgi:rhodanese-related sulfurtransferase